MPSLEKAQAIALSLFRAVVGFLFLCHGLSSVFGILGGAEGTHGSLPAGSWPGWWAALIQLVCGALVLIGLATRPAAVLGSGSMAYAYFTVHIKVALFPIQNGGEPAVMFCWSLLLIALLGPGPWALDRLFSLRRRRTSSQDVGVAADDEPILVGASVSA